MLCSILPSYVDNFLQNALDFSFGYFSLPITLRMICGGYTVFDILFSQQLSHYAIYEIGSFTTNYPRGGSKTREYVLFDEF